MYRAQLEQEEVNNVEKKMSTQFAAWLENHVCSTFYNMTSSFMIQYIFKFTNSVCFLPADYQIEI
jgi:hypothetical protein